MRLFKSTLFAFICVALSTVAYGQNKNIQKADLEFSAQGYSQAATLYISEVTKLKNMDEKGRVLNNIAECYRLTRNYAASLEYYEKAINAKYDKKSADVYLHYGMALQEMERLEDATAQFTKYKERGGDAGIADSRIAACNNAAQAKKASNKSRIVAENVEFLNSPEMDYGLAYSSKKYDEFVFSSSRKESTGSATDPVTGAEFQDLYVAKLDKKNKFVGAPTPVNSSVNTEAHEGAAAMDRDYKNLIFTRCGYDKKDRMGCDLYTSSRQGDNYAAPTIIDILDRTADDSSRVGQPCVTPDEKYLLFASNMPGGKGGRDIWYLTWDKKAKKWSDPKNLSSVNTDGDEYYPFVDDNGMLYFASNGYGGLGGLDIYKAASTGEMTYGTPTALPAPINSSSDDFALIIDKKYDLGFGCYFTSNRPGGKGKDDIWHAIENPLEFTMTGIAYNRNNPTQTLANCAVTVVGEGPDGTTVTYNVTTNENGAFFLDKSQVKAESKYSVNVSKENFIGSMNNKFSTRGAKESTNYQQDYFLIPIELKEYPMPTVLYPYDRAELLINSEVNSADSLHYLLTIMQENPNIVVQLESHTDARGDDKYNQELSQRRAQTCVDYLINKGIPADRLIAKGMGETSPRTIKQGDRISPELLAEFPYGTTITEAYIATLTDKDAQDRAHQLNRRTTFRIVRADYVPKGSK